MLSPTLTGKLVNTVPASVRCIPSIRMSLMTNGAMAMAALANKPVSNNRMGLSCRQKRPDGNFLMVLTFFNAMHQPVINLVISL